VIATLGSGAWSEPSSSPQAQGHVGALRFFFDGIFDDADDWMRRQSGRSGRERANRISRTKDQ
jgi:hypothetical protein